SDSYAGAMSPPGKPVRAWQMIFTPLAIASLYAADSSSRISMKHSFGGPLTWVFGAGLMIFAFWTIVRRSVFHWRADSAAAAASGVMTMPASLPEDVALTS